MNRNFFVLLVILPLMFIECDFGGASSKKNVVTTPSSDKAITDFSFASPAAAGVIDETLGKNQRYGPECHCCNITGGDLYHFRRQCQGRICQGVGGARFNGE